MPKSPAQKKKLVLLKDMLYDRTDERHPVSTGEIIAFLRANGISCERKSVYDDIEVLRELGADIRSVRGKKYGYYIGRRDFSTAELKLLVDAVSASSFITPAKSKSLSEKLAMLAPRSERKALNRAVFVTVKAKSENEDIFRSVDRIHEAIENDLRIAFYYYNPLPDGKRELHRGGARYDISPWQLVWDDGNYYLIGYDHGTGGIRHFRVDRMASVSVEYGYARGGAEEYREYDITSYSGAMFGMFSGKPQTVTISFPKEKAYIMLDRFGRDTPVALRGDRMTAHVHIVPGPTFFGWVLSFGGEVDIIAPEELRNRLRGICAEALNRFGNT